MKKFNLSWLNYIILISVASVLFFGLTGLIGIVFSGIITFSLHRLYVLNGFGFDRARNVYILYIVYSVVVLYIYNYANLNPFENESHQAVYIFSVFIMPWIGVALNVLYIYFFTRSISLIIKGMMEKKYLKILNISVIIYVVMYIFMMFLSNTSNGFDVLTANIQGYVSILGVIEIAGIISIISRLIIYSIAYKVYKDVDGKAIPLSMQ